MTLEELRTSPKETVTPTQAAELLGCNPYSITLQAREHPELLGFRVSVIGRRTYISRRSLLRFLEGVPDPAES